MDMNYKRIGGADFVRAISTLGIVIFHTSCEIAQRLENARLPFYLFENGGWGETFVTVFFVLSGFVLFLNNPKVNSLKTFYVKRWKSIFPMFYFAYLLFYIEKCIRYRRMVTFGKPIAWLLTLTGLDGYFSYRVINNYILGEWFLGAIVILYMLYPLLCRMIRYPCSSTALILTLFIARVFVQENKSSQ